MGIGPEILDLFFGRPLSDFLEYYGLTVEQDNNETFTLRPVSNPESDQNADS
jgi:hypothetical protein